MPRSNRAWRAVSALVLALFLASACGGASPSSTSGRIKAVPRATPSADAFACASVQGLLGHLAAGTARWSPKANPFDKAVAAQIRTTSVDLQRQLQHVRTVVVLKAVYSSAKAFNSVAMAMTAKNRKQVARAITATQAAYHQLKRVCGPA